jgi:uncharacterized repeat protein (TIGR03847 family)
MHGENVISLHCEKEQVQALAAAIEEMLANLEELGLKRDPDLEVDEAAMTLKEPVDPLFRIGAMGLGYDVNRDRILLVAQELLSEEEQRDPLEVRFFATRAQMQALSTYAMQVVASGRSPEQVALQADAYARRNGHGE